MIKHKGQRKSLRRYMRPHGARRLGADRIVVVSKPGAVLLVEDVQLSEATRRRLSTGVTRIPG